jgi:hypothetical protein
VVAVEEAVVEAAAVVAEEAVDAVADVDAIKYCRLVAEISKP